MDASRTLGSLGAVALSALFVAGCATVRPDFQRRFHEGRSSHDLWMSLLATRYGCDTAVVAASPRREPTVGLGTHTGVPGREIQIGMGACDVASLVSPEVIAAWVIPRGVREEWQFRLYHGALTGALTSVYFEGRDEKVLRVVPPVPKPTS